jgi:riboflavin transporter FmnP
MAKEVNEATFGSLNARGKTLQLAKMGLMVAISIILVAIVHFPIIPGMAFLEYDPADVPILIGTFSFGPLAGLALTVIVSVVQGVTVSAGSGPSGILMHIVSTGVFALVAGLIYKRKKTRKTAAVALVCGTLAMAAVMAPANLIITPMFMGVPVEAVASMLPMIVLFNFIKAGLNSLATFVLYKRISKYLHSH